MSIENQYRWYPRILQSVIPASHLLSNRFCNLPWAQGDGKKKMMAFVCTFVYSSSSQTLQCTRITWRAHENTECFAPAWVSDLVGLRWVREFAFLSKFPGDVVKHHPKIFQSVELEDPLKLILLLDISEMYCKWLSFGKTFMALPKSRNASVFLYHCLRDGICHLRLNDA